MEEKQPKSHDGSLFATESIWKILWKISPPVMLAQLILAMYNIVDSFFIGQYSGDGLTALAVIFPVQLVITALAVGTGVGVNTQMARQYARGDKTGADKTAGCGMMLAVLSWAVVSVLAIAFLRPFVATTASSPEAVMYAYTYGIIVCVGSLGTFLEGIWSKVHQAGGNMALPMVAQIVGAVTNIIFDPILIFGAGSIPAMGVAGAAYATVLGQVVSALIVGIRGCRKPMPLREMSRFAKPIYKLGFPSIFMQGLYTVYILILNYILAGFSDQAVTVLGLYYKLQSFFFVPLNGLHTSIVPLISYNYARRNYDRCRKTFFCTIAISAAFMLVGVFCFEVIPGTLIRLFSQDAKVLELGLVAFRIIGTSFVPICVSLTLPIFFQAIGDGVPSVMLSLTRQIFCLVPIFWLFSFVGLSFTWLAFPLAEIITSAIGGILYFRKILQIDTPSGHLCHDRRSL